MVRRVSARDLRLRLGTYLRRVRSGQTLVVTHRGCEIAELRPLTQPRRSERKILEEMAARGEISLPNRKRMTAIKPIRLPAGVSASETVIEGRADRI
jgi:prevent-host-death family protein